LSQTSKKVVFLSIFYLFSSRKSENRRAEQVLPGLGRVSTSGKGEVARKRVGE
jgi:hypothetical protein